MKKNKFITYKKNQKSVIMIDGHLSDYGSQIVECGAKLFENEEVVYHELISIR